MFPFAPIAKIKIHNRVSVTFQKSKTFLRLINVKFSITFSAVGIRNTHAAAENCFFQFSIFFSV